MSDFMLALGITGGFCIIISVILWTAWIGVWAGGHIHFRKHWIDLTLKDRGGLRK